MNTSSYGLPTPFINPIEALINLFFFLEVIIAVLTTIIVLISKRKTAGYNKSFLLTGLYSAVISLIFSFTLIELYAYLSADPTQSSYYRTMVFSTSSLNILYFYFLLLVSTIISVIYLYMKRFPNFATKTTIILCLLFSLLLNWIPSIIARSYIYEPAPIYVVPSSQQYQFENRFQPSY